MNKVKSKEPATTPATDNSEFTKLTPEQRKKFLSYDFKIDKDFLTNIENNITGIVDLKILDVLFLKNTYGDFKEIKSRFYQKNENGKLYLEQIINHYFEIKKRHKIDGILIQFIIQQKEIALINEDYLLFTKINNKYILPISNFLDTLKQLLYFYNAECEVESNTKPAQQHPQVKPLAEKINWKAGEDILRTHLEKLRDKKFIDYDNIDSVMSGKEVAVFIKHDSGELKATNKNAVYLFKVWYDLKLIDKSFIQIIKKENKEELDWQINSFIIDAFNDSENIPFKSDSLKKAKQRDFSSTPKEIDYCKNIDLYNNIESILI